MTKIGLVLACLTLAYIAGVGLVYALSIWVDR